MESSTSPGRATTTSPTSPCPPTFLMLQPRPGTTPSTAAPSWSNPTASGGTSKAQAKPPLPSRPGASPPSTTPPGTNHSRRSITVTPTTPSKTPAPCSSTCKAAIAPFTCAPRFSSPTPPASQIFSFAHNPTTATSRGSMASKSIATTCPRAKSPTLVLVPHPSPNPRIEAPPTSTT